MVEKTVWLIMSKDRTKVATGNVRARRISNINDNWSRLLTYKTSVAALSAFKNWSFCGVYKRDELEPVKCKIAIEEIKEGKI